MQFATFIALCLPIFICQLVDNTQAMESVVWTGRAHDAADSFLGPERASSKVVAALDHGSWIPPVPDQSPRFKVYIEEYREAYKKLEEPLPALLTTEEPENADVKTLGLHYAQVNINLDDLAQDDPRKLFISHLQADACPDEYPTHFIQLGFKNILDNHDAKDEQVKEWLTVLAYILGLSQSKFLGPEAQSMVISALYGLYSLRLKYQKLDRILAYYIDGMTWYVEHIPFKLGLAYPARWEKEILPNYMNSFGKDLDDLNTFKKIIENETQLKNAMSSSEDKDWNSLRALCASFGSPSAHKRKFVTALIFYNMSAISFKQFVPDYIF
ncbi:hypothetical protein PtA15_7A367 [Puccinia triticina]|uniref:Uncharacterized protein n=1 Tax=Puccinia triticina TaxID=208348 RepID=A0ABY7CPP5_9BASI|nr:uncharacterized protein PtA15_7A367 [Puccinia triticina]WAQ86640.1 hypothetical protein PtA15_7A367 [Puccinia triticina]